MPACYGTASTVRKTKARPQVSNLMGRLLQRLPDEWI